jgi:protein-tyrosine kinase
MSRVFDALRSMEKEQGQSPTLPLVEPENLPGAGTGKPDDIPGVRIKALPSHRIVAMWEPHGVAVEKFRSLVTRLENLCPQRGIRSIQVTSGMVSEGKTLVATNLAFTFAKHSGSRVLLLEGDLRKPSIAELLGLSGMKGLVEWWSEKGQDIAKFLYRLDDMPLWILSAGKGIQEPSHFLQSSRFSDSFRRLRAWFDWIIVDSTPMLPIADTNLWSRLVDGTLLVVREGVASKKALEKGLASLDNLNLIGTVLNASSEPDRAGYTGHYYGLERKCQPKATRPTK